MTTTATAAAARLLMIFAAVGLLDGGGGIGGVVGCYTSIFSFGDSLQDTGNIRNLVKDPGVSLDRPPYGETFFGHPAGRDSNGRLVVDFVAEALGLPLLPPSLGGGDFRRGVNFAVSGATALPAEFFLEKEGVSPTVNASLDVQLRWAEKVLRAQQTPISGDHSGREILYLVGEIGGNDYNCMLHNGKTIEEARAITPAIVGAISSAVTSLIVEHGARTLVVPGNLPFGCTPYYLTLVPPVASAGVGGGLAYDKEIGCAETYNELSRYFNGHLKRELQRLRRRHHSSTIIYFDYYAAVDALYRSPRLYGFGADKMLRACCGVEGTTYNFDVSTLCGSPSTKACGDPSAFLSWDGIHPTEAVYRAVAAALLDGRHSVPPVPLLNTTSCFRGA